MVSPARASPAAAGCWCSRILKRRPYVRLIVRGSAPRHAAGLGTRIPKRPNGAVTCTDEASPLTLSSPCEGIDSERGIAWRCADSFSLRDFLRLSKRDKVPDHTWVSRTLASTARGE
ncbi:transposase [Rhodoblastus sp.]|uniref:transposase n=1 Tax=Rhodoblastus sp. TaxID=1962975 RepID=UPI003F9D3613